MIIKKIYSALCIVFMSWAAVSAQVCDVHAAGLSVILRQYKTTNTWHSGDLYEHSMWVAQVIEQWFDEENKWVDGLTVLDKRVMVIAGYLHDIGKAGDLEYVYYDKPNHPMDGMYYLLGDKVFYSSSGCAFDFQEWFALNDVSHDDQKIIALLAGAHWDFGGIVLKGLQQGKNQHTVFNLFLERLQMLAHTVEYNQGRVDERLVRMAMLINAADVKGAQPVTSVHSDLAVVDCEPQRCCCNMYNKLDFETAGYQARQDLILYFKKRYA